jgi:hypothetical protein
MSSVLDGSYSEKCIASQLSRDQISVLLFSVFRSTVLLRQLFKFQSMWSVLDVGDDVEWSAEKGSPKGN